MYGKGGYNDAPGTSTELRLALRKPNGSADGLWHHGLLACHRKKEVTASILEVHPAWAVNCVNHTRAYQGSWTYVRVAGYFRVVYLLLREFMYIRVYKGFLHQRVLMLSAMALKNSKHFLTRMWVLSTAVVAPRPEFYPILHTR